MNEDNKALIKALNDELELAKSLTKGLRNALIEAYDLIMELKAPKEDPEKDDFEALLKEHITGLSEYHVYERTNGSSSLFTELRSGTIDLSDCIVNKDKERKLESHLEYLKTVNPDWEGKDLQIQTGYPVVK